MLLWGQGVQVNARGSSECQSRDVCRGSMERLCEATKHSGVAVQGHQATSSGHVHSHQAQWSGHAHGHQARLLPG